MAINLKQPEIITASYRIVTPMFIGDARQQATGISPASVKGALRFWWRALQWGQIRSKYNSDSKALERLHKEEGKLFGSTSYNNKKLKEDNQLWIGQSRFVLRVDASSLRTPKNSDWPKGGNDASGYLGMGLWQTGTTPARQYIPEKQRFSLTLLAKKDELTTQLKDALLAWGLFGGLGSRSRRAFGSIAVEKINTENYQFADITAYQNTVDKLLNKYRLADIKEPPFSSLSSESTFSINQRLNNNARNTHAVLGQAFKDYRGQPSHLRGAKKKVFGLPLTDVSEERRASPLFLHIHPIGQQFTATILYLPAEFHYEPSLKAVDYSLAKDFLDKHAQNTVIV